MCRVCVLYVSCICLVCVLYVSCMCLVCVLYVSCMCLVCVLYVSCMCLVCVLYVSCMLLFTLHLGCQIHPLLPFLRTIELHFVVSMYNCPQRYGNNYVQLLTTCISSLIVQSYVIQGVARTHYSDQYWVAISSHIDWQHQVPTHRRIFL